MVNNLLKTFAIALLIAPFAQAQNLETDWIDPVIGAREETLGASVRAVEPDEAGGSRVTIAIPKLSMEGAENIEEVVVVGRQPDLTEEELEIRHEWVSDYENDYYGLVLHLGEDGNVPLRLYLNSPH